MAALVRMMRQIDGVTAVVDRLNHRRAGPWRGPERDPEGDAPPPLPSFLRRTAGRSARGPAPIGSLADKEPGSRLDGKGQGSTALGPS
ncbi:hypothetical protein [Streptomyces sp. GS7]|uniref:hypothetical protein n=1 Tax=Streptomyces sp. GS7 TaxID=2692234 RepID=UPI00131765E0|nr:hypothetical protein [Streptomyces sp. GS7]QHC23003.1 hypothetical protein GR130_17900 [Streptomyces sp. GS7]